LQVMAEKGLVRRNARLRSHVHVNALAAQRQAMPLGGLAV
jgi:hypothetical protein